MLLGASDPNSYGAAYVNADWSDYSVRASIQFSSTAALGGGISGRVNPQTGARYAAWIYPENSQGGSSVLKLVKFTGWDQWSGTPMQQAVLPGVGTTPHAVEITFTTNRIAISYDGNPVINLLDEEFEGTPAYLDGTVSADFYTDTETPISSPLITFKFR